jgi:anti-sigma regulatory factor (Ser/Thr protein kinase)
MHLTLCDLITDLVQNSIEAASTQITLRIEETETQLKVVIKDNGKGMSAAVLEKARDPFYSDGTKHKHRKVGLGLPFLLQTAEMTEGEATIESEEGKGTTVSFTLNRNHLDLPDFGNFTSAAVSLMTYGFNGDLRIERIAGDESYSISKQELMEVLGELNDLDSLVLLKDYIASQEDGLRKAE